MKKARKWLDDHGIEYQFHDLRADGLDRAAVQAWITELGWQNLVNRRSTSWKTLDPATREIMDAESAVNAILQQPTLIKRPLLDTGHERFSGFSAADYHRIFNRHTL